MTNFTDLETERDIDLATFSPVKTFYFCLESDLHTCLNLRKNCHRLYLAFLSSVETHSCRKTLDFFSYMAEEIPSEPPDQAHST